MRNHWSPANHTMPERHRHHLALGGSDLLDTLLPEFSADRCTIVGNEEGSPVSLLLFILEATLQR